MTTKQRERTAAVTHKEDPILSMAEVARRIGKSPSTVKSWCDSGLIKAMWIASDRVFGVRESEVNRLLEGSNIDARV